MINGIRKKLFRELAPRYFANAPLTVTQRRFVAEYIDGKFTEDDNTSLCLPLPETGRRVMTGTNGIRWIQAGAGAGTVTRASKAKAAVDKHGGK